MVTSERFELYLSVMVNPWTFPEAIEMVNNMSGRYLDLEQLGIKKFKLADFATCFDKLSRGVIGKASFIPN